MLAAAGRGRAAPCRHASSSRLQDIEVCAAVWSVARIGMRGGRESLVLVTNTNHENKNKRGLVDRRAIAEDHAEDSLDTHDTPHRL